MGLFNCNSICESEQVWFNPQFGIWVSENLCPLIIFQIYHLESVSHIIFWLCWSSISMSSLRLGETHTACNIKKASGSRWNRLHGDVLEIHLCTLGFANFFSTPVPYTIHVWLLLNSETDALCNPPYRQYPTARALGFIETSAHRSMNQSVGSYSAT